MVDYNKYVLYCQTDLRLATLKNKIAVSDFSLSEKVMPFTLLSKFAYANFV